MAAYASAVTLYTPKAERISRTLGILAGRIAITNYNSTTTEETDITKFFKPSGVAAIAKGIVSLQVISSSAGYVAGFDKATGKFKVYRVGTGTVAGTCVVKGGGGGEAMTLNPDSTSGQLTKAAATDRSIPIATLLGVAPTVAATALTEVANDVDVGTFDFIAVGFISAKSR